MVSYLNTLPLIYDLSGYDLVKGTPSKLADLYSQGLLDAAILPVYETLSRSDGYIVDGISISARVEAASVLCFLNKPIESVGLLGIDNSSRTSTHLLKLLLKEYYHQDCQYECFDPQSPAGARDRFDAYLLIGDEAIKHRNENSSFIDPAGVWHEWTGLPFVFAVWVSKEKDINLKNHLLESKKQGLEHIEEIKESISLADREFLDKYYGVHLGYDLGAIEKKSLILYQTKLYESGFLKNKYQMQFY